MTLEVRGADNLFGETSTSAGYEMHESELSLDMTPELLYLVSDILDLCRVMMN